MWKKAASAPLYLHGTAVNCIFAAVRRGRIRFSTNSFVAALLMLIGQTIQIRIPVRILAQVQHDKRADRVGIISRPGVTELLGLLHVCPPFNRRAVKYSSFFYERRAHSHIDRPKSEKFITTQRKVVSGYMRCGVQRRTQEVKTERSEECIAK